MTRNESLKCVPSRLSSVSVLASLTRRVSELDRGWKATALAAVIVAVDVAIHSL